MVTADFLEHQQRIGNDLSTPMPRFGFPGLVPGDRWCVTAANWLRAHHDGAAAYVVLASTHERAKIVRWPPSNSMRSTSPPVPTASTPETHGALHVRGRRARPSPTGYLAILAKESETVVGHVGKVIVVGSTLSVDDLRASLEGRIAALPSLTRRLGGPPGAPAWVPDAAFRLDDHLVDATPEPD